MIALLLYFPAYWVGVGLFAGTCNNGAENALPLAGLIALFAFMPLFLLLSRSSVMADAVLALPLVPYFLYQAYHGAGLTWTTVVKGLHVCHWKFGDFDQPHEGSGLWIGPVLLLSALFYFIALVRCWCRARARREGSSSASSP